MGRGDFSTEDEDIVIVVSDDPRDAERIAQPLRDRGWSVDTQSGDPAEACREVGKRGPCAVVISLDRDPQGPGECDLACALSVAQVAHEVPMIFVGGSADTISLAKQYAPGALFVDEEDLAWAVKRLVFRQ